jgi:LysM repeat protein
MKKLLPLFILIFAVVAFGQTPQSTPEATKKIEGILVSEQTRTPQEVLKAADILEKIVGDAGRHFKQGLLNLKGNRRADSKEQFNNSVEVFLWSGVNISANQKLYNCYNQLIETIYRIEFPSDAQLPQIRSLSATCGWNIENALADDIAKIVRPANQAKPTADNAILRSAVNNSSVPNAESQMGFKDQKILVSPLDELAKLELTPEEAQQENSRPVYSRPISTAKPADEKPVQQNDGKVQAVMDYFNENFHDPYSMRFVRWSPVTFARVGSRTFWTVTVKFRAKNTLGAYILAEETYYIHNGKVINPANYRIVETSKNPINNMSSPKEPPYRTVIAQANDTVAKIAIRAGADATEVAKLNGLLPHSILPAGREIKIPKR